MEWREVIACLIIYVDADACPVKPIIEEEATIHQIQAVFVCSFANYFVLQNEWVNTVIVDSVSQSADMYIINKAKENDLVITDDYGLASLAVSRGCLTISSRGKAYTNDTMDWLLFARHQSAKLRMAGERHKGPKRVTQMDHEHFRQTLKNCLQSKEGKC
jgi:uncharacterized protein